MGIQVNAENVGDALARLHRSEHHYGIRIRWRKGEPYDYSDTMLPGCIVNAVGMPGQEVERSFKSAGEALRYIKSLLKIVDDRAREQQKERAQNIRNAARLKKATAQR